MKKRENSKQREEGAKRNTKAVFASPLFMLLKFCLSYFLLKLLAIFGVWGYDHISSLSWVVMATINC